MPVAKPVGRGYLVLVAKPLAVKYPGTVALLMGWYGAAEGCWSGTLILVGAVAEGTHIVQMVAVLVINRVETVLVV